MASRESAAGQGMVSGGVLGAQTGNPYGVAIGAGIGGLMGYFGAEQEEKSAAAAAKKNEEFKKHQNKYAAFFGKQPLLQHERTQRSPVPAAMSGMTQGAYMGGMIGNMYANRPKQNDMGPVPPSRFNPYTGEPVQQTQYT